MKKVLSLIAIAAVALTALTGCAPKTYKVGLGTLIQVTGAPAVAAVAATKDAAAVDAADGKYGVNTYLATVTLDKDGKFVNVVLDVAQTSNLKFDATGALKTDLATYSLKTKLEKGDEYGMKGSSAIGKEWYEQANAFAAWTVGKTIDEVEALQLDADGKATDADVKANTSVHVNDFVTVLRKAVDAATEVKAAAKVGMGTLIQVTGAPAVAAVAATKTAAAVDAVDGKYGVNTYIANVALDKDGKFVSVVLDVAQTSNLKFDATGALKTDLAAYSLKTKLEKGDEYGMKGSSAIGKEWYEQANAFAAWCVGKTIADVEALQLDADGKATDADVLANTSVHVNDFVTVLRKAVDSAVEVGK